MRKGIVIFFCLYTCFFAQATHLRSGQITLKLQSGLTYLVTLKVYTNLGSEIKFGDGTLSFGDGSTPVTTPTMDNTPTGYPNVGVVEFSVAHTFPGVGEYVISYLEPNLGAGIINILNSVETRFYLESTIILETGRDSSSPDFLTTPFFRHPLGRGYALSNEAADKNDFLLYYTLAVPMPPGQSGYTQPEQLKVNNFNGSVTWDTKYKDAFTLGEFYFAVRVAQYDSQGRMVGYVNRTFQAILVDSNSSLETTNFITEPNNKIFVEEDNEKKIKVLLADNASVDQLKWEVFFDGKIANNITFSQYDSASGSRKIKVGLLTMHSTASIIRDNPYAVTIRGTSTSASPFATFSKDICYLFFTNDINITAVNDQPKRINLYPNPFDHDLYVDEQSDVDEAEFIFTDITGKIVLHTKQEAGEPIDTSSLPAGMYVLQGRSGLNYFRQKVIKK